MFTKEELELLHDALGFEIAVADPPSKELLALQTKVIGLIKELET